MSELKMSDVFNLPLFSDGYMVISETIDDPEFGEIRDEIDASCGRDAKAIVQAINNHDCLVEENQRLTAIATKHATRADELYEALLSAFDLLLISGWDDSYASEIRKITETLDKSRIEAEKGDGICN